MSTQEWVIFHKRENEWRHSKRTMRLSFSAELQCTWCNLIRLYTGMSITWFFVCLFFELNNKELTVIKFFFLNRSPTFFALFFVVIVYFFKWFSDQFQCYHFGWVLSMSVFVIFEIDLSELLMEYFWKIRVKQPIGLRTPYNGISTSPWTFAHGFLIWYWYVMSFILSLQFISQ